jgi:hypothetical protein
MRNPVAKSLRRLHQRVVPSGKLYPRKHAQRPSLRIEDITIEETSGNVFADLGLPNPEQELARAQAQLASRIDE